jgi:hypothetical protein
MNRWRFPRGSRAGPRGDRALPRRPTTVHRPNGTRARRSVTAWTCDGTAVRVGVARAQTFERERRRLTPRKSRFVRQGKFRREW